MQFSNPKMLQKPEINLLLYLTADDRIPATNALYGAFLSFVPEICIFVEKNW